MTKTLGTVCIAAGLTGLSMVGCGGGSAPQGSGDGTQQASGGEVAGETEGFDMEGFEQTEPTIDHGTQSARQLLGVNPPPRPWHQMSHDEQVYWMVSNVLPIAAEDFRAYDAERYATVTCETCHGENPEAVHYELPIASLPRLPAPGSPQWQQMQQSSAYAFMNDVVTPTMATLLGEERWSPQNTDGFGCFECHTQRQ
ncbi:MAG: hypothetical protein OHK0013_02200 [Sandaracinaceae bacterium]